LTALGVRNYVVCPTRLDERHQGVANDRTDALELATRLDRYVAGNERALAVVQVPTEAEEQKRAHKRQRQQLREQRLSLAAQGRSRMLLHGRRESNHWWQPARWARLEPELAGWLVEPEHHQGGQPALAHGPGRTGLAAAPLHTTHNTIVGGRPQGRLTRIAGRDVSKPDGHTVGKTFSRKELWGSPWQPSPARSAASL